MTDQEAINTVCGLLLEAVSLAGAVPIDRIEWPNVGQEAGKPPLFDGNEPWMRVTIQFADGSQRTFGPIGSRRFDRVATITVQCFVPAGKRGLVEASDLARVARDAFEGRTLEGVTFYRVSRKTVGPDGPWYQENVQADFEFEELK